MRTLTELVAAFTRWRRPRHRDYWTGYFDALEDGRSFRLEGP